MCIPFLPNDAYQDIFDGGSSDNNNGTTTPLLDKSILDDFYLGNLICKSILLAIEKKINSYKPITVIADAPNTRSNLNVTAAVVKVEAGAAVSTQDERSDNDCDKIDIVSNHYKMSNVMKINKTNPLERDTQLLRQLYLEQQQQQQQQTLSDARGEEYDIVESMLMRNTDRQRAMYGLTIRIDELQCLEGLRKEILKIMNCLAKGYSSSSPSSSNNNAKRHKPNC